MEKTKQKAEELTHSGSGGHHIGDFLPPEELTKFMSKFEAIKSGQEYVEESDYAAQKLKQDNLGFKMLQRMGWNEGTGLVSSLQTDIQRDKFDILTTLTHLYKMQQNASYIYIYLH